MCQHLYPPEVKEGLLLLHFLTMVTAFHIAFLNEVNILPDIVLIFL